MIRQRVAASLSGRLRPGGSNPPPSPPEPEDLSLTGSHYSSSSSEDEESGDGKPWMRVDRSVYEEQLEQMQEQLVQVMLENQALQGECVSGNFRTAM